MGYVRFVLVFWNMGWGHNIMQMVANSFSSPPFALQLLLLQNAYFFVFYGDHIADFRKTNISNPCVSGGWKC